MLSPGNGLIRHLSEATPEKISMTIIDLKRSVSPHKNYRTASENQVRQERRRSDWVQTCKFVLHRSKDGLAGKGYGQVPEPAHAQHLSPSQLATICILANCAYHIVATTRDVAAPQNSNASPFNPSLFILFTLPSPQLLLLHHLPSRFSLLIILD